MTHQEKLNQARIKFGRAFAHEKYIRWIPNRIPVLTRWAGKRP